MSCEGSFLKLWLRNDLTTVTHFLRLLMFATPKPRKRPVIKSYIQCYQTKKAYPHKGTDPWEVTRQEISWVSKIDSSHDHSQWCCLVPTHLEDKYLPSLRHDKQKGQHDGINDGNDRDASHLEILLSRVLRTEPRASAVKEAIYHGLEALADGDDHHNTLQKECMILEEVIC